MNASRHQARDLIVYDHFESVCCHKVRIALAEKGIAHEIRHVPLEDGSHLKPGSELLKVNPKGVVPVVVHRGKTVTESSIILEYLDDAFPDPALMPADPYWRARRRLWARWIDDEMHVPHVAVISFAVCYGNAFMQTLGSQNNVDAYLDSIPDPKLRASHRASFGQPLDTPELRRALHAWSAFVRVMDQTLSDVSWLSGTSFSLADIDVIPYLWRLRNLGLETIWVEYPRVSDWIDRVTARPSFIDAVSSRQPAEWLALMQQSGEAALPEVRRLLRGPPPEAVSPAASCSY